MTNLTVTIIASDALLFDLRLFLMNGATFNSILLVERSVSEHVFCEERSPTTATMDTESPLRRGSYC